MAIGSRSKTIGLSSDTLQSLSTDNNFLLLSCCCHNTEHFPRQNKTRCPNGVHKYLVLSASRILLKREIKKNLAIPYLRLTKNGFRLMNLKTIGFQD